MTRRARVVTGLLTGVAVVGWLSIASAVPSHARQVSCPWVSPQRVAVQKRVKPKVFRVNRAVSYSAR